ncbi:unnamed protein product [Cyprideis torosa]|uniref:Dolichyl-diphosphooligosaccharide--protein glycosyltransferase subunit TMEM258 n=1 Tax=Cyprideis torosa TaxID=163714 RepID=A0A7R8WK23_9CRUS|nr:unnamed protein product [Cyprideis torosa]CAG0896420.1 unnamed protein product [Cyprideis torosa]
MFKRKLAALGYHTVDMNPNDNQALRTLVAWLEDRKIRHYKMEERAELRDKDSPIWQQTYETYLKDLDCPIPAKEHLGALDWLLTYAVQLVHNDDPEKYKVRTAEKVIAERAVPAKPSALSGSPFDFDLNSEEFKKGINQLARLMNISQHPDHIVTLQAIASFVEKRLSVNALKDPSSLIVEGKPFPIQERDLGFDTGDKVLNQACQVLRLLHIHDLRDLQTKINEIIVAVQGITSNPKTNTALGKVDFSLRNDNMESMSDLPRFVPPVNPAVYPHLSLVLLAIGIFFTAWFFVYEATSNKYTRDFRKELLISAVAALFMGHGTLFTILWAGIYPS